MKYYDFFFHLSYTKLLSTKYIVLINFINLVFLHPISKKAEKQIFLTIRPLETVIRIMD